MSGALPFLLLALVAGVASVLQTGVNSSLAKLIASPWPAATVSFCIGALAMVAFTAVTGGWASLASAARLPMWLWTGGIMGAVIVCTAIVAAPHIGAAAFVTAMVAGQLVTAILCDHYGWLGFPRHAVSLPRLVGAAMVFGGVVLVRRF